MSDQMGSNEPMYANLDRMSTEDLVSIWVKNDRSEWSDEAFEAIEQILQARLGTLPAQDTPIEDEEEAPSRSGLMIIAGMANVVSWAIGAYYLVLLGLNMYYLFLQGAGAFSAQIFSAISPLFTGLFFFLVLQGVYRGLKVLVEIADNLWILSQEE